MWKPKIFLQNNKSNKMKDKSFTQALKNFLPNKNLKMRLRTMKTKNNKLNKSPIIIENKNLLQREKMNEWRKTQRSNVN